MIENVLNFIGSFIQGNLQIFTVLVAVLIAVFVLYVIQKIMLWRADQARSFQMVFLKIGIPKKESKEDKETEHEAFSGMGDFKEVVGIMSHLFEELYSIYSPEIKTWMTGQEYISFEYVGIDEKLYFYLVLPGKLAEQVEKQITAFYPDSTVEQVSDYNIFEQNYKTASCYLKTAKGYEFPIKTYENMKSDPLNSISNAFSKLEKKDGAAIQILLRPLKDGWQNKVKKASEDILENRKSGGIFSYLNPIKWLSFIFHVFARGESDFSDNETAKRTSASTEEVSKMIDEKGGSVGFESVVRIVTSAKTQSKANHYLASLASAFQQFSSPKLNGFAMTRYHNKKKIIRDFIFRAFRKGVGHKRMIFSPDELASLWHVPSARYNRAPNISWQRFKVAPAPDNIGGSEDKNSLYMGQNIYRGVKTPIYLKHKDRFRHFYVIGQTGTGKSSIFQTMLHQDFKNGEGVAVIDPHGQLIEDLLPHIPRERADDVIYFNPADTERPMGLNLLEAETEEERDLIALDAMNIMIKLFNEETFGPRIQDYFRNGCLTLMEDPDGSALTDIVRLFTDDAFQKYKISKVKNPVVRSFWENQMAKTGAREKGEMIPYFAAKFGAFITNTLMRNIIGQTKSAFDFTEVMQQKKILLVNLSKGLLGDINSKLLGLILVNKLQTAALRRQKMKDDEREPFFLYIDEFQNYITDSIESILSEARKYKLGLNLAHQYIDQLTDERGSEKIKNAVFGNVGTMMCYKIGAQDAEFMAKEMEPVFSDQDLINLDAFKTAIKLSIDTQPSRPFSMEVQKPWEEDWLARYKKDMTAAEVYKEISRLKYGREKEFVSREIERRIGATRSELKTEN